MFCYFLNMFRKACRKPDNAPPLFFKHSNTNIYSPELHALGKFATSHKFMRECFNESLAQNMNNILQVENELNRVFRSWHYQTCNEFGWFQSGDAKNHAFGISPPLEFYLQRCKLLYGDAFGDIRRIEKNVKRTNLKYGGLKPNVTNVYFTHGSMDPWQLVGISSDLNEHSPAALINGTSFRESV